MTQTEVQTHLEVFRKAYYSTRVKVFDNHLVYYFKNGSVERLKKVVEVVVKLIEYLNLPLVVEHDIKGTDSFIIKSK